MEAYKIERRVKLADKIAGVGILTGLVGGYLIGEDINNYVMALREAPDSIKYGIDITTMFGSAFVTRGIGSHIGDLVGRVINIFD